MPAATAIAVVSSVRCRLASPDTSAAVNAAVSPASSATAASATARNASASRSAMVPCGEGRSSITGQAEPVAAAQHGLHDLRVGWLGLDLAAQVLHMRVDGALIALELVPADPVDQLIP